MGYSNLYTKYCFTNGNPNSSGEVSALCPFHDDNSPSFSYNEETGIWYCHTCEEGGSPEHFVHLSEGVSYEEARRIVREALGKEVLPSTTELKAWHHNLAEAPSVQGYLKRRGIYDLDLLEKYEVGWDGSRITIPVRDEEGKLLNVRRIAVNSEGPKVLNWPGFGGTHLWPMDQLEGEDVLLCAGESDTLSAILQGHNAITNTSGETGWKKEFNALFAGKDVYIVYDGDNTGRRAAQDRAIDLNGVARTVYMVPIPDEEDVNSLHQKGDLLVNYIEKAIAVGLPGARRVTGVELMREAEEEAKRPWLIEGLIRPGWLGVMGGHAKAGKTTWMAYMSNALIQGEPFLERSVEKCKATQVVYVSYEMANLDLAELYQDIMGPYPEDWPDVVLDPPRPLEPEELRPFLDPEPGLVIIDSAQPAFGLRGEGENQSGEVGHYLRGLQSLARRTGWAIIIIHHLNKSSDGGMLGLAGSREWSAAPDIIMTWVNDKDTTKPGTLDVEGRVPPIDKQAINMTRTGLEIVGTADIVQESAVTEEVTEALMATPGLTQPELGKLLNRSNTQIWRTLSKGPFFRVGRGKRGDPYRWFHKDAPPRKGKDFGSADLEEWNDS